jgi:hypothetical protein
MPRLSARMTHRAAMAGTAAVMVKGSSGVAWMVLFNSRPQDQTAFLDDAQETVWQAVRAVSSWPSHDLFGRFDEIIILGGPPERRQQK